MSALEFMQRLSALIPRPGLHLIRFNREQAHDAKQLPAAEGRTTGIGLSSRFNLARSTWRRSAHRHQTKPCLRRLHAHGLAAKIPRTRRWCVTRDGRQAMGTSLYLREHHFPNGYAGAVA